MELGLVLGILDPSIDLLSFWLLVVLMQVLAAFLDVLLLEGLVQSFAAFPGSPWHLLVLHIISRGNFQVAWVVAVPAAFSLSQCSQAGLYMGGLPGPPLPLPLPCPILA